MKQVSENLKKALEMMLFYSDQHPEFKDVNFESDWYNTYTYTAKDEEKYMEWLVDFLKDNWQGIVKRKLSSKKERAKFAQQFILNYGLKVRPLNIEDFGMELVPDGQLREIMTDKEYNDFMEWMFGQTCSPYGIYRYDLKIYLNKL